MGTRHKPTSRTNMTSLDSLSDEVAKLVIHSPEKYQLFNQLVIAKSINITTNVKTQKKLRDLLIKSMK
jgi:hypothetical protein